MSPYALSAILICAVALAIYEIRDYDRRMTKSLKDWMEEKHAKPDRH
jgi:hypothetical protein